LDGSLTLLQETLQQGLPDHSTLTATVQNGLSSVAQIAAVIRALRGITDVKQTTYYGRTGMIDIAAALREELAQPKSP
jgi:hypothetical protein